MIAHASPERLSEVLRLCTLLADRVLDAKIMERPVPSEQAVALAKAARLLQDHGVEWPPLVTQALHELAEKARKPEPEPEVESLKGYRPARANALPRPALEREGPVVTAAPTLIPENGGGAGTRFLEREG